MQFNKYNSPKPGYVYTGSGSGSGSGSNDNDTRSGGSRSEISERILWGNEDDGGNINESIYVRGNLVCVTADEINEDNNDDDDDNDDLDIDNWDPFPDEDGNIYAHGLLFGNTDASVNRDVRIGRNLYVKGDTSLYNSSIFNLVCTTGYSHTQYVDVDGVKTNLEPMIKLIKDVDDRLAACETSIRNHTTSISSINQSITSINQNLSYHSNIISNLTDAYGSLVDAFNDLKARVEALES